MEMNKVWVLVQWMVVAISMHGGLGVSANTSGGRLSVGISRDGLGVVTDAELDSGSCRQGGLSAGASPGMMTDIGLRPAVHLAWTSSVQSAQAGSDADGLVLTVHNSLVLSVFEGLVLMVCGSLVLMVCDVATVPELGVGAQWGTLAGCD